MNGMTFHIMEFYSIIIHICKGTKLPIVIIKPNHSNFSFTAHFGMVSKPFCKSASVGI